MPRYVLPNDPGLSAAPVTPSDTEDLPNYSRMLYVGSAGDIKVTTLNGDTVTFRNVPVGMLLIQAKRVWADELSADDIVAVW